MKYAITGHTHGIGLALSRKVDFIGFSRSNGYDISTQQGLDNIIKDSQDCDVFVNNAYSENYQTDLLYRLFNVWSHKKKTIINIGSNTTDGIKTYPHIYSAHKASLEKSSEQLANLGTPCRVCLIKFGWVGTKRVLNSFKLDSYINVDDAAQYIIDCANFKYRLSTITILPN